MKGGMRWGDLSPNIGSWSFHPARTRLGGHWRCPWCAGLAGDLVPGYADGYSHRGGPFWRLQSFRRFWVEYGGVGRECFFWPPYLIFLTYTLLFSTPKNLFFFTSVWEFLLMFFGGVVINWANYCNKNLSIGHPKLWWKVKSKGIPPKITTSSFRRRN